jgi:hypothetical protein
LKFKNRNGQFICKLHDIIRGIPKDGANGGDDEMLVTEKNSSYGEKHQYGAGKL